MAFTFNPLAAAAVLALGSLGACATQEGPADYASPPPPYPVALAPAPQPMVMPSPMLRPIPVFATPGLLASPPADARPGECFAKVVVPGQPIPAPPPQPQGVWVMTPQSPGQVGPTWCLYFVPGPQAAPAFTPASHGWIRVICDRDATRERIRHIQQRLNAWGYYQGSYDGRFDTFTARGISRFQSAHHIDHGGYLSMTTVDALDSAPVPEAAQGGFSRPAFGYAVGTAPMPYVQQSPAYPNCAQIICIPARLPCGAPRGCGGGGSGPQVDNGTPPYRSLLWWPGKTVY